MPNARETVDEAIADLYLGDYTKQIRADARAALRQMAEFMLEQVRNDPGSTLYGIPMSEITRLVMESKRKAQEVSRGQ